MAGLSRKSNHLLLMLLYMAKRENQVKISQKSLSQQCDMSISTLRKAIVELKEKGLITTEVLRGFRKNYFIYKLDKVKEK